MPISGPDVHRQLIRSYADGQARLESVRSEVSQTSEQREDLDDDRGDALVDLAEHYLPELTRDAIRNTWAEVRTHISEILLRKEDHRRRLQQTLGEVTARRETAEQTLLSINEDLDRAIEMQQQLAEKVENELRQDSHFVELSNRAAVAEAALERAEANLDEIGQSSARKLPAYDDSTLFRYLHDRRFGTPEYTHRGFTRRMDRWLAKYIDYQKARESYEFLKRTPEQMRQIIAEDRGALDTVMQELEKKRDTVSDTLGLSEAVEQSEALQSRRDEQLDSLDDLRNETEGIGQELTDLEETRGPYYREAVALFRDRLERIDSRDLKDRARSTSEITDDQIVARLLGVDAKIGQMEEAAEERLTQIRAMQDMVDALGRLLQRFRAAGYDSSRAQFDETLDVIGSLHRARNADDIDMLWQEIRRAHSWGPTAMDKVTKVATHPMTQVLINAMAHAAGGALRDHAGRAGRRRDPYRGNRSGGNWHYGRRGGGGFRF